MACDEDPPKICGRPCTGAVVYWRDRQLHRLALEPLFCGCLEPVGLEGLAGSSMISGGQAGSIPSLSMCP